MNRKHLLEPAATVLAIIGDGDIERGELVAAEVIRRHRTVVRKWTYPRSSGGTGGLISQRHAQALVDWARRHGKPLSPSHFFVPAAAAE